MSLPNQKADFYDSTQLQYYIMLHTHKFMKTKNCVTEQFTIKINTLQ